MNSSRQFLSSALALAALLAAHPARAQQPTPVRDSLQVRDSLLVRDSLPVEVDSTAPQRNWVVNVLRKVTFRGDGSSADSAAAAPVKVKRVFDSRRDRLEYEAARARAERATGFHVVVDIGDHRLWVIDDNDTLRTAPVATASNSTLKFGGKTWHFETPRGVRTVLAKDSEPSWTPPEWHYAEVASEYGLKLRHLQRGERVRVRDGTILTTRGDEVGVILPDSTEFIPLVLDEQIVFDNTLFIPPAGTKHRSMKGELGHYRLRLGDGYLLHGTPYTASIGSSVTHGCVRMHDDDIEWLYHNVPVGTKVYLY